MTMYPNSASNIYSVSSLTTQIGQLLQMSYQDVWIEGEVSSAHAAQSGHTYFTLKEDTNAINCVLFKNKKYLASCLPTQGERLLIRGKVALYAGRSEVQIVCAYIEAAGEGALRRAFEALKSQLKDEGLFDAKAKQSMPAAPRYIALITSSQGAVIHDIRTTLKKRYPLACLRVYSANVQGNQAKVQILARLSDAIEDQPDVIILARGGGSLDDLQVFNEESLARALFECPIPTISAIGHETDIVITDFVADMRAPTPTAAITLLTPDIAELQVSIEQLGARMMKQYQVTLNARQQSLDKISMGLKHPAMSFALYASHLAQWRLKLRTLSKSQLQVKQISLDYLGARLLNASPNAYLDNKSYKVHALQSGLVRQVEQNLQANMSALSRLVARFEALSPLATLQRGYAIIQDNKGNLVRGVDEIQADDVINAQMYQGKLKAKVIEVGS